MSVRIKEWINGGWVTLTLKPGVPLYRLSGGPTDEGYDWTGSRWLLEHGMVTLDRSHDGCDCDGRISSYTSFECPVTMLKARWNDYAEQYQPAWEVVDSVYRDYAAEAAGY